MFAFGIYDKGNDEIFLCRDRLGIKPLYYYHKDGKFAFASELSALKVIPGIDLEIDPIGLDYYFTYGYIPAPFSAYKFIRKLPPAHVLVYDISRRDIREIKPYWRIRDAIQSQPYNSEQDWIDAIEGKIAEAIKLRLMSDVPLGVFLSGGLDSSLVVSLMADMLEQPVKTFTIGFEDEEYDERSYAESVARRYRTEHHVEVVKPDAIEILPQLIKAFGEPFYDKSAIPTYYLSKMARKHVTVVLSGDGGDEVFAGYTRYSRMHRYAYLSGIPIIIRKIIQHLGMYLPKHLPGYGFLQRLGYDKFRLYQEMHSCFPVHEQEQLYSEYFKNILRKEEKNFYQRIIEEQDGFEKSFITQLQLIDLHSYLPEDILTKVDRMSMLHSLETRVPLLDHELIELVYACPPSILFKNRTLKYIIKTILQDKVPSEIVQHKKQGFGVPLPIWFRNELKNLTESLIDKSKSDPFINNNFVNHLFHLHQKGGRNFSRHLYAILFYLYWRSAEERG
jgi:asparagine synthase (glutamine-hydrolysing)